MKYFKNKNFDIFFIIFMALFLRVFLSFFGTLHLDQGTFIAWSTNLANNGFATFYSGWSDYFPGYLYILWILGKVPKTIPSEILYKIPAIISDLLIGYLIYKIVVKIKDQKWGLIASSLFLFNPAVFANSALWGQVDSLTALFSLLSIYFLPSNFILSAIFLSVGTLVKPQAAFIVPVILFLMLKNKFSIKKLLSFGVTSLSIFLVGFLPFWDQSKNFLTFVLERINVSLNQYQNTSVNAFNFWGLTGFWRPDNVVYQVFGYLAVFVVFLLLAKRIYNKPNAQYYLTSFVFAASFLFFTRMHERHLLPVFAFLPIVVAIDISQVLTLGVLSLMYIANLYYSYVWITNNFETIFSPMAIKTLIVASISSLVFFVVRSISKIKFEFPKIKLNLKTKVVELPKVNFSPKKSKAILLTIIAFSFLTRVYKLGLPSTMYFDEVYHAFTAKLMLQGDPKSWEWWNPNPEGFAYEWTHPPTAKLGMALGMRIFGENAFGWRIVQAVLGTGVVYLIYLLAKQLFKDEVVALLSSSVFALDGLALVISRIGMNDTYMLFFMLASLLLFMRKKDVWSAISFGLAISSKWSAIWAVPIFFTLWLKRKNKFEVSTFISFMILPIAVYLLSYLPMFLTGNHDLGTWWGVQQQMWWYHTGLRATHPYTSPWWSWPILMRPIYLYTSEEVGGMVSRIYAMGNPIVFWFGLSAVVTSFIYSFLEKNKNLGLTVFSYLVFFVPWAASPRIMFLYHYLPSIPFLAIATGYVLRRSPKLIPYFLISSLLAFVYFYPHWAGLQIPIWLDTSYYWLTSWR